MRLSDHAAASEEAASITAANAADGSVTFANLYFTEADAGKTFAYTMTESIPAEAVATAKDGSTVTYANATDEQKGSCTFALNGISYASSVATVWIKVTDNGNGTLSTEVTYGEKSSTDAPTFTNEYNAAGSGTLGVNKILSGRGWYESDEFHFTLTPREGAPMPTWTDSADPETTWTVTAIKLTKEGLVYTVSADGTTKDVTVHGSLHVNQTTKTLEKAFALDYELADLDVDSETGLPATTVFEYLLVEDPADDSKQQADGRFALNDLYYDTDPRTVEVTVSNDGSGGLSVSASVDGGTSLATFTNTYEVKGRIGIDVEKVVYENGDADLTWDEHVWSADDSYTFTITKDKDWYPDLVVTAESSSGSEPGSEGSESGSAGSQSGSEDSQSGSEGSQSGSAAQQESEVQEQSIVLTKNSQVADFVVAVDEDDFIWRNDEGNALDEDGKVITGDPIDESKYVYLSEVDFYYTVTETAGAGKGVTISKDSVKVKVHAVRSETAGIGEGETSTLKLTVYYSTDDGKTWTKPTNELPITIYNEYEATGEALVDVSKTLSGRTWTDEDSFAFTIKPLTYKDGEETKTSPLWVVTESAAGDDSDAEGEGSAAGGEGEGAAGGEGEGTAGGEGEAEGSTVTWTAAESLSATVTTANTKSSADADSDSGSGVSASSYGVTQNGSTTYGTYWTLPYRISGSGRQGLGDL